jgi:hypothetical protein
MSRPSLFDRLRARLAVIHPVLDATNGPCLVLGSAPDPILPVGYGAHWTFVSVNAAQAGAARAGIDRIPDLTVMSGQMLGKKPENLAGQKALRDARTTQLLLVERGVSAREARPALRALNYQYGALRTMDHWQRAGLTYRLLGEHPRDGIRRIKDLDGRFRRAARRVAGLRTDRHVWLFAVERRTFVQPARTSAPASRGRRRCIAPARGPTSCSFQ